MAKTCPCTRHGHLIRGLVSRSGWLWVMCRYSWGRDLGKGGFGQASSNQADFCERSTASVFQGCQRSQAKGLGCLHVHMCWTSDCLLACRKCCAMHYSPILCTGCFTKDVQWSVGFLCKETGPRPLPAQKGKNRDFEWSVCTNIWISSFRSVL